MQAFQMTWIDNMKFPKGKAGGNLTSMVSVVGRCHPINEYLTKRICAGSVIIGWPRIKNMQLQYISLKKPLPKKKVKLWNLKCHSGLPCNSKYNLCLHTSSYFYFLLFCFFFAITQRIYFYRLPTTNNFCSFFYLLLPITDRSKEGVIINIQWGCHYAYFMTNVTNNLSQFIFT